MQEASFRIVNPYVFVYYSFDLGEEFDRKKLFSGRRAIEQCLISWEWEGHTGEEGVLSKIKDFDERFFTPSYFHFGRFCRLQFKPIKVTKTIIRNFPECNFKIGDIDVIATIYDVGVGVICFCFPILTNSEGLSVDEIITIQRDITGEREKIVFSALIDRKICECFSRTADPIELKEHVIEMEKIPETLTDALETFGEILYLKWERGLEAYYKEKEREGEIKLSLIRRLKESKSNMIAIEKLNFYLLFKMIRNFLIEKFRDKKYRDWRELISDLRDTTVSIDIQLLITHTEPDIFSNLDALTENPSYRKIIYGLVSRDPNWRLTRADKVFELISPDVSSRDDIRNFVGFDSSIIFYKSHDKQIKDVSSLPDRILRRLCIYNIVKTTRYILDFFNRMIDSPKLKPKKPRDIAIFRDFVRKHVTYYYTFSFMDESSFLMPYREILDECKKQMRLEEAYKSVSDKLDQMDRKISIIYSEAAEKALLLLNIIISGTIAFAIIDKLATPAFGQYIAAWLYIPAWIATAVCLYYITQMIKKKLIEEFPEEVIS